MQIRKITVLAILLFTAATFNCFAAQVSTQSGKAIPFVGSKNAPVDFATGVWTMAGWYHVTLKDKAVLYEHQQRGGAIESATIKVSPESWAVFRDKLDDIGVWKWDKNYPGPPDLRDGESWNVKIIYPDKFLESQGMNNYPGHDRDNLKAYFKAVEKLIGMPIPPFDD